MSYLVTLNHLGNTFYLKSTIWTASLDRAQKFETEESARNQLIKASKFMPAKQFKSAKIIQA